MDANEGGAEDGTKYCDAQAVDGTFCSEMDIMEANTEASCAPPCGGPPHVRAAGAARAVDSPSAPAHHPPGSVCFSQHRRRCPAAGIFTSPSRVRRRPPPPIVVHRPRSARMCTPQAQQFTTHACIDACGSYTSGVKQCEGNGSPSTVCDQNGCGLNPFRKPRHPVPTDQCYPPPRPPPFLQPAV